MLLGFGVLGMRVGVDGTTMDAPGEISSVGTAGVGVESFNREIATDSKDILVLGDTAASPLSSIDLWTPISAPGKAIRESSRQSFTERSLVMASSKAVVSSFFFGQIKLKVMKLFEHII